MTELRTLILKDQHGEEKCVQCSRDIFNILLSNKTDQSVKAALVESLLQQGSSNSIEKSPSTSRSESPATVTNSRSSPTTSIDGTQVWNWKPAEEDLLVSIRHEKNEKFVKSKNHSSLWKEISDQLNETLHCHITPTQAMNKYNSLKKKWKEVVDAGTGSERKYFRQKDQFDELYGCKESTKPSSVIDTLVNASEKTEKVKTKNMNVVKKKTLKRKSESVLDILEKHNKEMADRLESMHQEKMQKFDRLLNLYEKELQSKSAK